MTLMLAIVGRDRLDNGEAARMRLERHGACIGRSPHMDWSLPDPGCYISSSHCEIEYRDGGYVLTDCSTNGTYVNGSPERLAGPHRIADGDRIQIGHYEITARLEGEGAAQAATPAARPWSGWGEHDPAAPVGVDPVAWDRPDPRPAITGLGSGSAAWAPPPVEAPATTPASVWAEPAQPGLQPSAWSSEPRAPAPPSAGDIWGQVAGANAVDWSRGGFGAPPEPPPLRLAAAPSQAVGDWGAPPAAPAMPQAPSATAPPATADLAPSESPASSAADWQAFLAAAGLPAAELKPPAGQALAAAGTALRRLVAGMVVMLEARARAKAQLGAANTSLEFDGNNPLKFARSPELALMQLLNPPERGFMGAERAIEDGFHDLQAHQMATLAAMQGALAATLARFSPAAIRSRAETRGLLARILPSAREAALWQAYEKEFEGVAQGSDEAFMDVFAKEFREAYERAAADMKRKV
jgi:type VI secretion system FHA domain protein